MGIYWTFARGAIRKRSAGRQRLDRQNGHAVEDPDDRADHQGNRQHGAGVLHGGLAVGPDDLLQLAAHLAEPLAVVLLNLLLFSHRLILRSLGLGVDRVLLAEGAILVQRQLVRGILREDRICF